MSVTRKAASFPKPCAAGRTRVVLFDEIEKAHPDVMHLLLQILEEGKVTDSLGRKIDFRNTIIIMTSNVGAELIKRQTTMGFGAIEPDEADYDVMQDKILEEAKRVFKPEFLNRLDDIIVFHTLEKPDLLQIVDLEVAKVKRRLKLKEIDIALDEAAHEFLIEKGYDPKYGARPMRRAVERYLEDPLAEELLQGQRQSRRPGPGDGGKRQARLPSRRAARQRRRQRELRSIASQDRRRVLRPRMRVGVSLLQPLGRDVGVDLRRRKTGVA